MPTFEQIIRKAEDDLAEARVKLRNINAGIAAMRARPAAEKRSATPDELVELRQLEGSAELAALRVSRAERDLAGWVEEKKRDDQDTINCREVPGTGAPELKARSRVWVGGEPRTYSRDTAMTEDAPSFFRDMFAAEVRGDYNARDRLARHAREAKAEGEMSSRALATGGLAGLVPPQYLIEDYAPVLRAGRPAANLIRREQIPATGMVFQVPRGTTGASVGVQATENSTISTTDEVWSNVQVPVCTIAGYAPVSRQSLERGTPGIDAIIFRDLIGAYAAAQDAQVLSGSGSSGQMLGILSTSGVNQATAFTAAATATTFTSKLAGAIAAIAGGGATIRPRAIVMHPRRWGWWSTQVDTAGRPLVSSEGAGPWNASGVNTDPGGSGATSNTDGANVVGYLQGLPVITDANIPTNVGSGPEDQVIVLDNEASILWEDGSGLPATMAFEQTAATALTVTLVAYGYSAFTAGRYPTAVSVIGGNAAAGSGLVAVSY
jgi:HK97 family phage major capsid protein